MLNLRLPLPRFLSAGEVLSGKGSLAALKALDVARLAVLVSPSLARDSGQLAYVEGSLKAESVEVIPMPGGEPTLESVQPVVAALTAFRPDWIVAVGGGSVLDGAKLAWIFYEYPDVDVERIFRPFGLPSLRGKARFAAVPATAGTGSEVSSSTLLLDPASGSKRAVVSHELLPDIAILDPAVTVGVPPEAVAAAGLDGLAHALEGYVSKFKNPFIDLQAEKAVAVLLDRLVESWRDPADVEARLEVMHAAMMAGWVQNLKVPGVGHAIAHQLGGFGLSHGHAAGAMLVPAMQFNSEDATVQERYASLAQRIGLRDDLHLIDAVMQLKADLGLGDKLAAHTGADRQAILIEKTTIAAGAMNDVCAKANPVSFGEDDVAWLLDEVL